ncbi:MAG TPA: MFS transporter [Gaiellales bacterium]|nr:MFS transporter [Gaiellales bacterium]
MTGRRATLPLYLGGFLGPFGGAVLAVLIPELRDAFHATTDQVALAVPAYLVPFALLQVVSGTIGERIGRRRAVRAAYLVYAVALLLAAVAPTIGVFLVSRGLQGTANAFTTPLLLAGLADAVPAGERGRAVGMFAGVQAGGLSLAPLLGGLAAEGSWRLAFILPALVSLGLMLMPPPDPIRAVGEQLPTLRSVATPRMGLLCAAGFAGYLGMAGLAFLISLRADDAFALGATGRGAVLAVYGAAGLLFGRVGGLGSERLGPARAAVLAAIGCAVMIAPLGIAPSVGAMALLWFAAGAVSALLWAALNTIAVEAVPANRGGAVSLFAAFKFSGTAVAPLAWLPVYDASPGMAFLAAGIVLLAIVPLAPWSLRVP